MKMASLKHTVTITIPRRIGGRVFVAMGATLLLVGTIGYAADVATMGNGEALTSTKMNANFKALQDRISSLEQNSRSFAATVTISSTTTCALVTSTPASWISDCSKLAVGRTKLTLPSGTFSATPVCVVTGTDPNLGNGAERFAAIDVVSPTEVSIRTQGVAGSAAVDTESGYNIVCVGK